MAVLKKYTSALWRDMFAFRWFNIFHLKISERNFCNVLEDWEKLRKKSTPMNWKVTKTPIGGRIVFQPLIFEE